MSLRHILEKLFNLDKLSDYGINSDLSYYEILKILNNGDILIDLCNDVNLIKGDVISYQNYRYLLSKDRVISLHCNKLPLINKFSVQNYKSDYFFGSLGNKWVVFPPLYTDVDIRVYRIYKGLCIMDIFNTPLNRKYFSKIKTKHRILIGILVDEDHKYEIEELYDNCKKKIKRELESSYFHALSIDNKTNLSRDFFDTPFDFDVVDKLPLNSFLVILE
jgi:hypothetical protein